MSTQRSVLLPAFAFVLALSAIGCAKSEAPASRKTAADAPAAVAAAPAVDLAGGSGTAAQKPLAAGRALVVTADVTLVAKSPDAVAAKLREEVERAGGFVADASASGSGEGRSARLVLRVPTDRTRSLRAAMADLGKITSDTEKSEDVTEQRADLDARLVNARAQEKRLVEIMGHKTGTVGEVLEVERELARVRETVERLDAQKRGLDGKIDLATVTVNVQSPDVAPAQEEGALAKVAGAFRGGLKATGTLMLYAAMAFAAVSPVLVPLVILAGSVALFARRRRRAQLAAMAAAAS